MADADALSVIGNDPDVSYNMVDLQRIPSPFSKADAQRFINIASREQMDSSGLHFGIRLKVGDLVGASMMKLDLKNKSCEIAYWIGRDYRRKGYAREAVRLMLDFAFNRLKLNRVQADSLASNDASLGLLNSLGFTKEGTRRQRLYHNGAFIDDITLSLLKSEYSDKIESKLVD